MSSCSQWLELSIPRLPSRQRPQLTPSGIGLETCIQFASEGAKVVLADINDATISRAADALRAKYPTSEAIGVKCDVSKESDVQAMVAAAVDKWGRLDVLVSPCDRGRPVPC